VHLLSFIVRPSSTLHWSTLVEISGPTERVKAREEHIRETWVRAMEARIVRDELKRCQRTEGVNTLETCQHLADRYLTMLKENRVRLPAYRR
jgi:NADH dehydrogenase (ubiquinone) 1 beta subcomplex subunit 10